MKKASLILLVLLFVITACTSQPATRPTDAPATATLPDPQVHITPAPDIDSIIDTFLGAWQDENYSAMYAILTADTQGLFTEEDFTKKYLDTAAALTLQFDTGIDYEVLSSVTNPDTAVATIQLNYNTNLFGTLTRQIEMTMLMESGEWRLQWKPAIIMPELQGGHVLEIVRQSFPRSDIYAKDGSPIAAQEDAVAIGFTPGGLNSNLMSLFYSTMARLTIYQVDEIIEMVDNAYPGDYIS